MKKLIAACALALMVGGVLGGCAYGAMAVAQDGTVYVARNDAFLFGALRKIYACRPTGADVVCTDLEGAP